MTIIRTLDEKEVGRFENSIDIPPPGDPFYYGNEDGTNTTYVVVSTQENLNTQGRLVIIYVKPIEEMLG